MASECDTWLSEQPFLVWPRFYIYTLLWANGMATVRAVGAPRIPLLEEEEYEALADERSRRRAERTGSKEAPAGRKCFGNASETIKVISQHGYSTDSEIKCVSLSDIFQIWWFGPVEQWVPRSQVQHTVVKPLPVLETWTSKVAHWVKSKHFEGIFAAVIFSNSIFLGREDIFGFGSIPSGTILRDLP